MEHEEWIRRIFDAIINQGNLGAADEYMTEDFVDHGTTTTPTGAWTSTSPAPPTTRCSSTTIRRWRATATTGTRCTMRSAASAIPAGSVAGGCETGAAAEGTC